MNVFHSCAQELLAAAATVERLGVAIYGSVTAAKPTRRMKPTPKKAHWTQLPKNRAKVLAKAKRAMRTRRINAKVKKIAALQALAAKAAKGKA